MNNIAKWLSVNFALSWKYPLPDSSIIISASWAAIGYQWYAGSAVLNMIKLSNWWKDPLDTSTYYTYATNAAQSKFQILWFLEDWSNSALSIMPFLWNQANADPSSYSWRYIITKWDAIGIILNSSSLLPIQTSWTWVDVVLASLSYTAQFTNKDSVSWSWSKLVIIKQTYNASSVQRRDNSLAAYWDMDTILPNWTLADLSWNWNGWVASGWILMWWAVWKYGKATYFDWGDDAINTWSWINLNISSALTLYSWVKMTSSGSYKIITRSPQNTDWKFHLWISAGKANFWIKNTWWNSITWNTDLIAWVWYSLCWTYDGINMKIYLNWNLDNTMAMSGTIASWAADDVIWLWTNWVTNQFLSWTIDEARIYNRALSDSEISNLYSSAK
jgi:hypothetical protein